MHANPDRATFHRNGTVSVNKVIVGRYRVPDPSGAPWLRRPVWIFNGADGSVDQGYTRSDLIKYALSVYRRLQRNNI